VARFSSFLEMHPRSGGGQAALFAAEQAALRPAPFMPNRRSGLSGRVWLQGACRRQFGGAWCSNVRRAAFGDQPDRREACRYLGVGVAVAGIDVGLGSLILISLSYVAPSSPTRYGGSELWPESPVAPGYTGSGACTGSATRRARRRNLGIQGARVSCCKDERAVGFAGAAGIPRVIRRIRHPPRNR